MLLHGTFQKYPNKYVIPKMDLEFQLESEKKDDFSPSVPTAEPRNAVDFQNSVAVQHYFTPFTYICSNNICIYLIISPKKNIKNTNLGVFFKFHVFMKTIRKHPQGLVLQHQ